MGQTKYSEKFEKIFNVTRKLSDICGLFVTKKDYKPNWRTIFIFVLIHTGLALTTYTVYVESFIKGDNTNFLKTVSVIGLAFQGYIKAVTLLKRKLEFRFLYSEITGMYKTYELKSDSYHKALKYNISVVKKLLSTIFGIVIVTSAIVVGFPVFMLVVHNKRIEILPYQIPFINHQSALGYYITSSTHIVVVFFGGYGNFMCDSWMFTFTAHIPMLKNILKCKFDELDEISKAHPRNINKSIHALRDILKWHQKYITFCNTIKTTFFWVVFIQISTEFLCIVFSIICIFLGIWPPAPVFVFYLFAMIYTFSALGNLVEVSNDDIIRMIYDSCWYNLTVTEQKLILFMLRKSQQATGVTIGGFAPLSLNTALQLTKTIYTFTMMLKEFLVE